MQQPLSMCFCMNSKNESEIKNEFKCIFIMSKGMCVLSKKKIKKIAQFLTNLRVQILISPKQNISV